MSVNLQPPQPSLSALAQTLRFKKDPMGFMARVRAECGDIFSLRLLGMGLNARVLVAPTEHWEVALFGTNLTDETYLETGFFTGAFGPNIGVPARPREWGASVQFSF